MIEMVINMEIKVNNLCLKFENEQLNINDTWRSDLSYPAYVELKKGGLIQFKDFEKIEMKEYHSGTFKGFYVDYVNIDLAFRTFYLVDTTTSELMLRLVCLKDNGNIQEVMWPTPLIGKDGYDVLPYRQGIILPHDSEEQLHLPFDGQFCSAAAYLSMVGIVSNEKAVLIINETPWDSCYDVLKKEKKSNVCIYWTNSLGKMDYRRDLRLQFFEKGDYNTLAKAYRTYVKEKGLFKTLAQKELDLPQIKTMAKSSLVHMGISTFVQPESRFYDFDNPNKNNHLTPFKVREDEMKQYKQMGMEHLYLHLDGWGIAYDNGHPDVMPINQDAGGPQAMQSLVNTCHDLGYLFGIHDQYRDYYYRAKTHDIEFAIQDINGDHYEHDFWAGGQQNYLCASVAKDYVKRNFTQLKNNHIHLDGAYLDVFTCNDLDECANVNHLMTKKDCLNYRLNCFHYLVSQNIMPSSEEVNEWAIPALVFCHYAPYEFQMHEDGKCAGIAIPLFNLVYHDCVMIPWMMDKPNDDYMLYALLNGGMPYFRRDPAYPNIDGAFSHGVVPLDKQVSRCQAVSNLYQQIYQAEMVKHEFIDGNVRKQKTTFSNGICVEIDLDKGIYQIR